MHETVVNVGGQAFQSPVWVKLHLIKCKKQETVEGRTLLFSRPVGFKGYSETKDKNGAAHREIDCYFRYLCAVLKVALGFGQGHCLTDIWHTSALKLGKLTISLRLLFAVLLWITLKFVFTSITSASSARVVSCSQIECWVVKCSFKNQRNNLQTVWAMLFAFVLALSCDLFTVFVAVSLNNYSHSIKSSRFLHCVLYIVRYSRCKLRKFRIVGLIREFLALFQVSTDFLAVYVALSWNHYFIST